MDIKKAVDFHHRLCRTPNSVFQIGTFTEIQYGIQFTISTPTESGLLRIYQNKQGVLTFDKSQIKSPKMVAQISDLLTSITPIEHRPEKYQSSAGGLNKIAYPMIGTDEVGKGDYFGPLVIAGVWVDADLERKLASIGVRDSKRLSDSAIHEVASEIRGLVPEQYTSVVLIRPPKYNELCEKKGKKQIELLAWGHARALENILQHASCRIAIVDQFGDESRLQKALMNEGRKIRLIQITKAEQYMAVAAASILARHSFLKSLAGLSQEVGFRLPKGSFKVEQAANRIIHQYGRDSLAKYAKLHFGTTRKLEQQD